MNAAYIRKLANSLKNQTISIEDAYVVVETLSRRDGYNPEEAKAQVELAYIETGNKSLSLIVNEWVHQTTGWFTTRDLDTELNLGPSNKNNRRYILHQLISKNIIETHPTKQGIYRLIKNNANELDWRNADISGTIPIVWPFDLHDYTVMYPKNIVILAGSSNAGKTAFLLNTIKLNMANFKVHYFSSEMGPEELKLRLSKFDDVTEDDWKFSAQERSSKFADVITPDDINIIDYIEMGAGEFYLIGDEIRAIFDKLGKGIAVIALQKKKGAELGRGAEFSLEKPRLYLSMDSAKLKIVKAKNWAIEDQNPNSMAWRFKLLQGCKFVNIEEVASE